MILLSFYFFVTSAWNAHMMVSSKPVRVFSFPQVPDEVCISRFAYLRMKNYDIPAIFPQDTISQWRNSLRQLRLPAAWCPVIFKCGIGVLWLERRAPRGSAGGVGSWELFVVCQDPRLAHELWSLIQPAIDISWNSCLSLSLFTNWNVVTCYVM